jgi:hypothetical protein
MPSSCRDNYILQHFLDSPADRRILIKKRAFLINFKKVLIFLHFEKNKKLELIHSHCHIPVVHRNTRTYADEQQGNRHSRYALFLSRHIGKHSKRWADMQENPHYISSIDAASRFGMTRDHVAFLCRTNRVQGELRGKGWFVDEGSITSYTKETASKSELLRKELSEKLKQEYRSMSVTSPLSRQPFAKAPSYFSLQNKMRPTLEFAVIMLGIISMAFSAPAATFFQAAHNSAAAVIAAIELNQATVSIPTQNPHSFPIFTYDNNSPSTLADAFKPEQEIIAALAATPELPALYQETHSLASASGITMWDSVKTINTAFENFNNALFGVYLGAGEKLVDALALNNPAQQIQQPSLPSLPVPQGLDAALSNAQLFAEQIINNAEIPAVPTVPDYTPPANETFPTPSISIPNLASIFVDSVYELGTLSNKTVENELNTATAWDSWTNLLTNVLYPTSTSRTATVSPPTNSITARRY